MIPELIEHVKSLKAIAGLEAGDCCDVQLNPDDRSLSYDGFVHLNDFIADWGNTMGVGWAIPMREVETSIWAGIVHDNGAMLVRVETGLPWKPSEWTKAQIEELGDERDVVGSIFSSETPHKSNLHPRTRETQV